MSGSNKQVAAPCGAPVVLPRAATAEAPWLWQATPPPRPAQQPGMPRAGKQDWPSLALAAAGRSGKTHPQGGKAHPPPLPT